VKPSTQQSYGGAKIMPNILQVGS